MRNRCCDEGGGVRRVPCEVRTYVEIHWSSWGRCWSWLDAVFLVVVINMTIVPMIMICFIDNDDMF